MQRHHIIPTLAAVLLMLPLTACAATGYTTAGKTYTITKVITSDTRIGDNCTLVFKAGGQFRNCRITARNLRIVANGAQTAFDNVTLNGSIASSKLYATNFGARADMRDAVQKNWSFKGTKMSITRRTGTDNDRAWNTLASFLSNSTGVDLEFNGAFYSESSQSMNISNARNLTLHGGTLIKGINIIDCSDVLIYGMNIVGFHHAHDFPPIVDSKSNAEKGITVNGKTYNMKNAYCTNTDKMKDIGIAGDGINAFSRSASTRCENITIRDCRVEMRQNGIFAGQRSKTLVTRNVNVSNCTVTHVFYQPVGLHCQNAVYDNITGSYCLQPIDFSTCANNCTVKNSKFYDCCKGPKQDTGGEYRDMSFGNTIENCYIQINEKYFMADAPVFILNVAEGKAGDTFTVNNTQFVVNTRNKPLDGFLCRASRLLMNNVEVTINSSVPAGKTNGMMNFFAVGGGTSFSPIIECNNLHVTSNLKTENLAFTACSTVGPDKLQMKLNNCTFTGTAQFNNLFTTIGSVSATNCNFNLKTNYLVQSTPKVTLTGSTVKNVAGTAISARNVDRFDCAIDNCNIDVAKEMISVKNTNFKIDVTNSNVTSQSVVSLNDGLQSRGLRVENNQINVTGSSAITGLSNSHQNMFGRNGFSVKKNVVSGSGAMIPAAAQRAFGSATSGNTQRRTR